jgi:hypothetical protein
MTRMTPPRFIKHHEGPPAPPRSVPAKIAHGICGFVLGGIAGGWYVLWHGSRAPIPAPLLVAVVAIGFAAAAVRWGERFWNWVIGFPRSWQ